MNTCTKCGAAYVTAFPERRTLCAKCYRDDLSLRRAGWIYGIAFGIVLVVILYTLTR